MSRSLKEIKELSGDPSIPINRYTLYIEPCDMHDRNDLEFFMYKLNKAGVPHRLIQAYFPGRGQVLLLLHDYKALVTAQSGSERC